MTSLRRRFPSPAVLVGILSALAAVAARLVDLGVRGTSDAPEDLVGGTLSAAVLFSLTGGFLLPHPRARWVGATLFVVGTTQTVGLLLGGLRSVDASAEHEALLGGAQSVLAVLGFVLVLVVLPQIYPDGPQPGRLWRWTLAGLFVLGLLGSLALPLASGLGAAGRIAPIWEQVSWLFVQTTVGLGLALGWWSLVARWRRGDATDRRALRLFALVDLALLPVAVVVSLPDASGGDGLAGLVPTLGPVVLVVVILVGIGRHQLFDVRLVVRRAGVYLVLAGVVVATFVGVAAALAALVSDRLDAGLDRWVGVAGAALVVVVLEPVRRRLQGRLEQLVLGSRGDPLAALGSLRDDVTATDSDAYAGIVATLARAVRSPRVELVLRRGPDLRRVAFVGAGGAPFVELPLVYRAEDLGTLLVAPRTARERFSGSDLRLLDQLARQVGSMIYARRRDLELRTARDQLLEAVRQERARLGRDLHDGFAPTLAGAGLAAEALRRDAPPGSPAARDAARLAVRLRSAATDLRRLAHELQPADLDDGLATALRAHIERRAGLGVPSFDLLVEVDGLPTTVEQAAYLVVLEAVENVVRHADARHGSVRVCSDRASLLVSVSDDGAGLPTPYVSGLGIESMRRRVEGLGGSFAIEVPATGGTRVVARFPTG